MRGTTERKSFVEAQMDASYAARTTGVTGHTELVIGK
jgi:hypothetical protein